MTQLNENQSMEQTKLAGIAWVEASYKISNMLEETYRACPPMGYKPTIATMAVALANFCAGFTCQDGDIPLPGPEFHEEVLEFFADCYKMRIKSIEDTLGAQNHDHDNTTI